MEKAINICIVGGGPRLLYALDSISKMLLPSDQVNIYAFDLNGYFSGGMNHHKETEDCCYLNRNIHQISLGTYSEKDKCHRKEVSLADWVRLSPAREVLKQYIDEYKVPKRFLHGLAISDQINAVIRKIKKTNSANSVSLIPDEVTRIYAERLETSQQRFFDFDQLLLITGHSTKPKYDNFKCHVFTGSEALIDQFINSPYPLKNLSCIQPKDEVALIGMGLSSIDSILYLTEGRGGRFTENEDGWLEYVPSGSEPSVIEMFSRSGAPYSTRPNLQFNYKSKHIPNYLNRNSVLRLHKIHKLDFEKHILPLIVAEMNLVIFQLSYGGCITKSFTEHVNPFVYINKGTLDVVDSIEYDILNWHSELLEILEIEHGRLVWRYSENTYQLPSDIQSRYSSLIEKHDVKGIKSALKKNLLRWSDFKLGIESTSSVSRQDLIVDWIAQDIIASGLNGPVAPVKIAIEVAWRENRAILSELLDWGRLHPDSQRVFDTHYMSIYNRLSNGAGISAMRKIHALAKLGIVSFSLGGFDSISTIADRYIVSYKDIKVFSKWLVDSRVHSFDINHSKLYQHLVQDGFATVWSNDHNGATYSPGCLEISKSFLLINKNRNENQRIAVMGNPIERNLYFQNVAAREGSLGSPLIQMQQWANTILSWAREEARRPA